MARIILKGNEQVIAAGIGNSTNASNARLVRVYNPGGGSGGSDPVQVHIVDPTGANEYSGIGSCTVAKACKFGVTARTVVNPVTFDRTATEPSNTRSSVGNDTTAPLSKPTAPVEGS